MSYWIALSTGVVTRVSDGAIVAPAQSPDDPDFQGYVAWVNAGNSPTVADVGVSPVPDTVSPLQARKALLAAGLLDQVDAAVKGADQATQMAWEYATEIRREDPFIGSISATLNLTPAQVDDLFRTAASL